jgi:hypothetical protein
MILDSPSVDEYAPAYAGYVSAVAGRQVADLLVSQGEVIARLFKPLSETEAGFRYAPGKWSLRQVLGHLIDGERVFSYRAFRISRGDSTPLPGFDENPFVDAGNFDNRTVADLLDEFHAARGSTLALFRHISPDAGLHRGVVNGNPLTLRAQAHVLVGHVEHHIRILAERYGRATQGPG